MGDKKIISAYSFRFEIQYRDNLSYILTHWGRVTQICVFTLQLYKTDDANLRF